MSTKRNYKSDAFEAIHSAAEGLFKAGGFSKETMRDFDESCLEAPQQFEAKEIQQLRESHHMSQPVFARYLNTSQSTLEKWEAGSKHPSGAALKLLNVVRKHGLEVLR